MQRVELGGGLVRVHAVTQGQLRNATAVLSAEVIRYSVIVLGRVSESLRKNNI